MEGVSLRPCRHPVLVVPLIIEIPDDRSRMGWRLGMKCKWVRFVDFIAVVTRYHMVFVGIAMPNMWNKALPDARLAARIQLVAGLVPTVKRAHNINLFRIRRPYGEVGAFGSIDDACMRAKTLVQLQVTAFVKEVQIVIGEQRHRRVPLQRRPFFGFARRLAACGGASWDVLCWLLGHFEGESPARDLQY